LIVSKTFSPWKLFALIEFVVIMNISFRI